MCRRFVYLLLLALLLAGSAQAQFISAVASRNGSDPAEIGPAPLDEDVLVFVDRTHQYNDIPAYLIGAQVVMTANDDKGISAYELDVTISTDAVLGATLYVFVDNRMGGAAGGLGVDPVITGMPWLNTLGFVDTGDDIGIDESGDGDIDQYSSIFSKTVRAGETITIGGNTQGHGGNMLSAAVQAPRLKAHDPLPADGATQAATWASLGWTPGATAVSHDVYLGDNLGDVTNGTGDTFRGNTTDLFVTVGFFGFPYPDGLVPGTTYYWRVDEVESDGSKNVGNVWSFWVPPVTAYDPSPVDGAKYVDPDVDLGWTMGFGAVLNYVFFGGNFDDVNNATTGTPAGTATFNPGTLEAGKTYYWRVDEFNPPITRKGSVWSFTTLPEIPIADPNLVGWWKFEAGSGTRVIDFSGHGNHGTIVDGVSWIDSIFNKGLQFMGDTGGHVELPAGTIGLTNRKGSVTMWINTHQTNDEGHIWYACDETGGDGFGGQDEMHVNMDDSGGGQIRFFSEGNDGGSGDTSVDVDWGYDDQWIHVAATWDYAEGMKMYVNGNLAGSTAHNNVNNLKTFVRIRLGHANGGDRKYEGMIDDVRLFDYAISASQVGEIMSKGEDPRRAGALNPSSGGSVAINFATPLSWSTGENAVQHDVYFGTDSGAVTNADASDTTGIYRGRQVATSYTPAEVVLGGGPYYWRVDEVDAAGAIVPGAVWVFSVTDYVLVEDFDSYNDIESGQPGSNLVYETWPDGYGISTNGSTMGYAVPFEPTMESVNKHGGIQSAPMAYANTTAALSEVTRNFAPARNWTDHGVITLSLWFAGDPANVAAQLYVKINGVRVNYDGDPINLTRSAWQPWNIDLTNVGTNLASVSSLTIGVQGPGATGTLLLDDIRLYTKPRDLVVPAQPSNDSLLLHLALDEGAGNTAGDGSGNGRNGTINGATWRIGGYNGLGSCLDFGGDGDHVLAADATYLNDLDAITISVWVKSDVIDTDKGFLIFQDPTGGDNNGMRYDAAGATAGGTNVLKMSVVSTAANQQLESSNALQTTAWQHYAMVWSSGEQLVFYVNGMPDSPTANSAATTGLTTGFEKMLLGKGGKDQTATDGWDGLIDELRIYGRPLSDAEIAGLAGVTKSYDRPL